jgi:hypothetical protein
MPKKSRRRAARSANHREERQQDPRLIATQVAANVDGGIRQGDWIVVVSPVALEDGRQLMWHPPQAVTFNLLEAKKHNDRGVRQRRAIMGNLERRSDGTYGPTNSHAVIDCLSELVAAVVFSFTAIESLANHVIDMLPEETVIQRGKPELAKTELVRWLAIDDKFKYAVPLLEQGRAIAGDHDVWTRYQALKALRDEIVHVKARGYDPDPKVRTAYDGLVAGDGDNCVIEAYTVVEGAFPGFIPDWVAAHLDAEHAIRP